MGLQSEEFFTLPFFFFLSLSLSFCLILSFWVSVSLCFIWFAMCMCVPAGLSLALSICLSICLFFSGSFGLLSVSVSLCLFLSLSLYFLPVSEPSLCCAVVNLRSTPWTYICLQNKKQMTIHAACCTQCVLREIETWTSVTASPQISLSLSCCATLSLAPSDQSFAGTARSLQKIGPEVTQIRLAAHGGRMPSQHLNAWRVLKRRGRGPISCLRRGNMKAECKEKLVGGKQWQGEDFPLSSIAIQNKVWSCQPQSSH